MVRMTQNPQSEAQDEDAGVQLLLALTAAIQDACSLEEQIAAALAEPVAAALRRRYACEELYIPAPDKRERNESIRREFNGRNREEVMRKYGLSRSQLYAIVRRG